MKDSTTHRGLECARLFYRQELYVQHLSKDHKIESRKEIDAFLRKNRIGRNGQSQFWCGFCKKIIPLKQQGLEAWNERFNHIDSEHFKKGERIGDWLPPSGHLTKNRERDEERKRKAEKRSNEENNNSNSENDTSSSSSDSSCGDDEEIGESPSSSSLPAAPPTTSNSENHDHVRPDTAREMSVEILDVRPQQATAPPTSNNSRKRKWAEDTAIPARSYDHTTASTSFNATTTTTTRAQHVPEQTRTSNSAAPSSRRSNPTPRGGASATASQLTAKERRAAAALLFSSTTEEPEKRNRVFCVSSDPLSSSFCCTVSFLKGGNTWR